LRSFDILAVRFRFFRPEWAIGDGSPALSSPALPVRPLSCRRHVDRRSPRCRGSVIDRHPTPLFRDSTSRWKAGEQVERVPWVPIRGGKREEIQKRLELLRDGVLLIIRIMRAIQSIRKSAVMYPKRSSSEPLGSSICCHSAAGTGTTQKFSWGVLRGPGRVGSFQPGADRNGACRYSGLLLPIT
jgi:hypothetical protein